MSVIIFWKSDYAGSGWCVSDAGTSEEFQAALNIMKNQKPTMTVFKY